MTRTLNVCLMAGASAMVLGLAAMPAPAQAFDEVNWVWNAEVDEIVTKDVVISLETQPSGMAMIEDLQVSVGDITAVSSVTDVDNNQPTSGGTVDLGEQSYQFKYGVDGDVFEDPATPDFNSEEIVASDVQEACDSGTSGCDGEVMLTVDLGEVDVPATDSYDATTELPEVISAATAVANNTAIESDVHVELHEKQVAIGNTDGPLSEQETPFSGLQKAQISALSTVTDILNASVDSTATAVANNLTVDLTAGTSTDGLMLADIQQWSVADVTATSRVSGISVNNYTNLGSLERPLVNSVATAVGNNKAINVSLPAAE